jgi:hypothetical protein
MNLETQFAAVRHSLVAELVSHKGGVEAKPVEKAFDELALAVRIVRPSRPYGAIITSVTSATEPATVWRSYLNARDHVADVLAQLPANGQDLLACLKSRDRPGGISVISTSQEANPRESILEFARHRYAANTLVDDVFLLLSGEELLQMTKQASSEAVSKMLLLLHVSGETGKPWMHSRVVAVPEIQSSNERDDDDSTDGPTLAWRQAFITNVPSWSAEEVARQGGHQAKNKSAAASRLASDGRIFAVAFGGKLRYPKFQFKHGKPRAIVARILQSLGSASTDWDRAFFFAEPNVYLDDARPMDRLDDQKMEERLVQLANRYAHPADVF